MATNPPRNNRPDSSGVTGFTSGSAGDRTPPDLALWGIRGLISVRRSTYPVSRLAERPKLNLLDVRIVCDDPAYECLVADPALTILLILLKPKPIAHAHGVPPLKPAGASCALPGIFRRSLTFTYHECPTVGRTHFGSRSDTPKSHRLKPVSPSTSPRGRGSGRLPLPGSGG